MAASDDKGPDPQAFIDASRARAHTLFEGVETPHRSCGISIAETFHLRTSPYQGLRRGGITGQGECGAVVAGRLVLGELLGDPDPTGPVTPVLREAVELYNARWRARFDALGPVALEREDGPISSNIVCNRLTGIFPIFQSVERRTMCTAFATEIATTVAEVLVEVGHIPSEPEQ